MRTKRALNRLTATLLALIMCISILPTPAFADKSDGLAGDDSISSGGDWLWDPSSTTAVRMTIVWSPFKSSPYPNGEIKSTKVEAKLVGKPIDIVVADPVPTNINWYYSSDIYSNILSTNASKAKAVDNARNSYTSMAVSTNTLGLTPTFPRVVAWKWNGGQTKGVDGKNLSDYLVADNKRTEAMNTLLTQYREMNRNNFKDATDNEYFERGYYEGQPGYFYAFFEPMIYTVYTVTGEKYALTMRDILNNDLPGNLKDANASAIKGLANGLYLSKQNEWDGWGLHARSGGDVTKVSQIKQDSMGVGIVSITPQDKQEGLAVASQINVYLDPNYTTDYQDRWGGTHQKLQSTSIDYVGSVLDTRINGELVNDIINKLVIISAYTQALQFGAAKESHKYAQFRSNALTTLANNYGLNFDLAYSMYKSTHLYSDIGGQRETWIAVVSEAMKNIDPLKRYVNIADIEELIDKANKSLFELSGAELFIARGYVNQGASNITIGAAAQSDITKADTEKIAKAVGNLVAGHSSTELVKDIYGYSQPTMKNAAEMNISSTIPGIAAPLLSKSSPNAVRGTIGDYMEPVAEVTLFYDMSGTSRDGSRYASATQAGLIRDFIEEVITRVTYTSMQQYNDDLSDFRHGFDSVKKSNLISDALASVLGWGQFNTDDAVDKRADTLVKALLEAADSNDKILSLEDLITNRRLNANSTDILGSELPDGTFGMTLSEWAIISPWTVFKVITDERVADKLKPYIGNVVTITDMVESSKITDLFYNDYVQTNLEALAKIFTSLGFDVDNAEEYEKLVRYTNVFESTAIVKTQSIISKSADSDITEVDGTKLAYVMRQTSETGTETISYNYSLDEAALATAMKAAIKVLYMTDEASRGQVPIRSLESTDTNVIPGSLLDTTKNYKRETQIGIVGTMSIHGKAEELEAFLPEVKTLKTLDSAAMEAIKLEQIGEIQTTGEIAPDRLRETLANLLNGKQQAITKAKFNSEVTAEQKITGYSLANISKGTLITQSGASDYENGIVNMDGLGSVTVTIWGETHKGDILYVEKDGNNYKLVGADVNSLDIPVGGSINFALASGVSLSSEEYDIKAAMPAGYQSNYSDVAKALINGDKRYTNNRMISVRIEPGEQVLFGNDIPKTSKIADINDRVFATVTPEEYTAMLGGDGTADRFQVVVLVEKIPVKKLINRYDIYTDENGNDTPTGPSVVIPNENNTLVVDKVTEDGYKLIEWKTSTEDTNPQTWVEVPSTEIKSGTTDPNIPITEDTTTIYIHYSKDPKQTTSGGAATLSEKRITGSKLLSQISQSGLLSNDFSWASAGTHGCSCHCGGCSCEDEDGNPDCTCNCGGGNYSSPIDSKYDIFINNLNESNIGVSKVVASTSTGKFAPSYDNTSNEAHNTNAAWSGGSGAIKAEYYLNLFRGKDLPTIASYANTSGTTLDELGITSGITPTNARNNSNTYNGTIDINMAKNSLSDLALMYACAHGDGATKSISVGVSSTNYKPSISVQTYLGTANKGQAASTNQATNGKFTITIGGKQTTIGNATGTVFTNASAFKFYPYVEMIAESWNGTQVVQEKVNVLGGHESVMASNDYIEVGYTSKAAPGSSTGLVIESTQWSAHQQAVSKWGKDVVLPGGAIYTLKTPNNYNTDVGVSMWLTMLEGDTIASASTNNPNNFTEQHQLSEADEFLATVKKSLDSYDVVQHIASGKFDSPATILSASKHKIVGMAGGTPLLDNQVMTNDAKYFLTRNTALGSNKANEADLDILNTQSSKTYYAVWSDVNGNVYVGKGATMAAAKTNIISQITKTQGLQDLAKTDELRELDAKTKLLANFISSIDRNQGNDPDFGGTWYNEAWKPVFVCRYDTIYTIGFNTPTARTTAVDTHLEPPHTSRSDMLTAVNSSVFKVNAIPSEFRSMNVTGYLSTFRGQNITMANVTDMYVSKVFYIPNASVTDLVNY